ncbi:MAG: N-acetylmuramoyl-L-alanine amidase [Abditibacteriota bacterium]|nr:N-acetylmuramoyl-L-alanine amidase [Abditibacteriota bacterium]
MKQNSSQSFPSPHLATDLTAPRAAQSTLGGARASSQRCFSGFRSETGTYSGRKNMLRLWSGLAAMLSLALAAPDATHAQNKSQSTRTASTSTALARATSSRTAATTRPTPAHAFASLGGPMEIAQKFSRPALPKSVADARSPQHKTRYAQIDSPTAVGALANGATGAPAAPGASGNEPGSEHSEAGHNPPASLGALPVDLAIVRRVRVAGKSIVEQPLRVGNLDILAPIVDDLAGLGASASRAATGNVPGNINTPTEEQYFQINLPQGAPIVLTVGKATAYINNVEQPLRAAPLVMKGKIWLPLFSIAPLLGAAARLESDGTLHLNPTVQSVEIFPVKGMTVLTIKTSAPLRPNGVLMGTMDDPPKLYLDFPGYSMGFDAAGSTTERVISGGLSEVTRVRGGLFQKFPDTTRVVLDLKKEMSGVSQPLPDKTIFALILVPPGKRTASGMSPSTVAPTSVAVSRGSLRGLTIVVDAGHGGHDNGAGGARSHEKHQALDISRRLAQHLRNRGANVLMTRDGDYFVTLQGRVDFANSRKADIFLSVHINSFRSNSSGTETFYNTSQSLALAREVHKELARATGLKNRGVSNARFFVIRKTWMPSILTETAFISNPREEALLISPEFREKVARGMAQGVQNYVDNYMRQRSSG